LRVSENKQVHSSKGSKTLLVGIGQYCTVLSVAVIAIALLWKILIVGRTGTLQLLQASIVRYQPEWLW